VIGRLEPVPSANNYGSAGIGKERQDVEMLDSTTLGPRQLESQRIAKETVDQKLARQVGCVALCRLLQSLELTHSRSYYN
jgi:hypothetical protein